MTDSMRNNHPFPAEPTQIIYVEGSDRQIGQQHAEQLGAKIAQGMAPFYTAFFDRVSNPLDINFLEKVGLGCLQKGLDQFLVQKLIQRIPMEFKERISGMSEVSQVEEGIFLKAFILPDLLPMLQAYLIRLKPQLGISVALPQLEEKGSYKEGKKDGVWEYYYKNGQIKEKGSFKEGKEDGVWELYYENGQLEYRGSYKKGYWEGVCEQYNDNGQLKYKGSYKDGEMEGVWEIGDRR